MKKQSIGLILLGFLLAVMILMTSFSPKSETKMIFHRYSTYDEKLSEAVYEILNTKCNVCHRKQNPFMVFRKNNMAKKATKIYEMVFVEKRMPKGDEITLTEEEYMTLQKWLKTQ